jgi:undecaprenyl-diphosphatase
MRYLVDSITRWDILWFTTIFGLNGKRLVAAAMPWVSRSGDGYLYPLLAAALMVIDAATGREFLAAALAAFALELPAYKLMKHYVKRDRPCEKLPAVHGRIVPSDRFSFPSGHTAAAFLIATLLGHLMPALFPAAGAWALAVGFSRIYLGVHYPTDILAGMFIGLLSGTFGIAMTAA